MTKTTRRAISGRVRSAWGALLAATLIVAVSPVPASAQETAACSKSEFEDVVDQAASALRDLNNKNRPAFQDKLRQLKDKRHWDNDQFMTEAAPFVKDDEIETYDTKTNDLLGTISAMGQEGANAKLANCALLSELRGHMTVLIDTQSAKWAYMFKKLEAELAK